MVAQYTILQRFGYHICINNFSVGKCYHVALSRRSITKTCSVRLHLEDSFRTQMLLLWQLLIEMLCLFLEPTWFLDDVLGFYTVNFLCFKANRENIQRVSTDKATRKYVHQSRRNSQLSLVFDAYDNNIHVKSNSERKKKPIHMLIVKKIHRLESAHYALLDHSKSRYH